MPNLDDAARGANLDTTLRELVRNTVQPTVEFDVVVDVDASFLALCDFKTHDRKWAHCGQVECLEGFVPGTRKLLESARVELQDKLADGVIEVR
jgi:hypothetical protein